MAFVKLNWKPDTTQLRQFGAVFLGGFVALGLAKYFWPFNWLLTRSETAGFWLIAIGLIVGGIGLTGSRIALPFYWTWLGIAYVLGNVMSRVIMALIYFGVFTPMRLVGVLIGRDPLQLKKPQTGSYWRDIKLPSRIEDYEKQF